VGKICDDAFGLCVFRLILYRFIGFSVLYRIRYRCLHRSHTLHFQVFNSKIFHRNCYNFKGLNTNRNCGGADSGLLMEEIGESCFTKEMPYRKSTTVFFEFERGIS